MKKTEWYPADTKPVREGWYQTRNPLLGEICFGFWWNGFEWRLYEKGNPYDLKCLLQEYEWRGLTEPPHAE